MRGAAKKPPESGGGGINIPPGVRALLEKGKASREQSTSNSSSSPADQYPAQDGGGGFGARSDLPALPTSEGGKRGEESSGLSSRVWAAQQQQQAAQQMAQRTVDSVVQKRRFGGGSGEVGARDMRGREYEVDRARDMGELYPPQDYGSREVEGRGLGGRDGGGRGFGGGRDMGGPYSGQQQGEYLPPSGYSSGSAAQDVGMGMGMGMGMGIYGHGPIKGELYGAAGRQYAGERRGGRFLEEEYGAGPESRMWNERHALEDELREPYGGSPGRYGMGDYGRPRGGSVMERGAPDSLSHRDPYLLEDPRLPHLQVPNGQLLGRTANNQYGAGDRQLSRQVSERQSMEPGFAYGQLSAQRFTKQVSERMPPERSPFLEDQLRRQVTEGEPFGQPGVGPERRHLAGQHLSRQELLGRQSLDRRHVAEYEPQWQEAERGPPRRGPRAGGLEARWQGDMGREFEGEDMYTQGSRGAPEVMTSRGVAGNWQADRGAGAGAGGVEGRYDDRWQDDRAAPWQQDVQQPEELYPIRAGQIPMFADGGGERGGSPGMELQTAQWQQQSGPLGGAWPERRRSSWQEDSSRGTSWDDDAASGHATVGTRSRPMSWDGVSHQGEEYQESAYDRQTTGDVSVTEENDGEEEAEVVDEDLYPVPMAAPIYTEDRWQEDENIVDRGDTVWDAKEQRQAMGQPGNDRWQGEGEGRPGRQTAALPQPALQPMAKGRQEGLGAGALQSQGGAGDRGAERGEMSERGEEEDEGGQLDVEKEKFRKRVQSKLHALGLADNPFADNPEEEDDASGGTVGLGEPTGGSILRDDLADDTPTTRRISPGDVGARSGGPPPKGAALLPAEAKESKSRAHAGGVPKGRSEGAAALTPPTEEGKTAGEEVPGGQAGSHLKRFLELEIPAHGRERVLERANSLDTTPMPGIPVGAELGKVSSGQANMGSPTEKPDIPKKPLKSALKTSTGSWTVSPSPLRPMAGEQQLQPSLPTKPSSRSSSPSPFRRMATEPASQLQAQQGKGDARPRNSRSPSPLPDRTSAEPKAASSQQAELKRAATRHSPSIRPAPSSHRSESKAHIPGWADGNRVDIQAAGRSPSEAEEGRGMKDGLAASGSAGKFERAASSGNLGERGSVAKAVDRSRSMSTGEDSIAQPQEASKGGGALAESELVRAAQRTNEFPRQGSLTRSEQADASNGGGGAGRKAGPGGGLPEKSGGSGLGQGQEEMGSSLRTRGAGAAATGGESVGDAGRGANGSSPRHYSGGPMGMNGAAFRMHSRDSSSESLGASDGSSPSSAASSPLRSALKGSSTGGRESGSPRKAAGGGPAGQSQQSLPMLPRPGEGNQLVKCQWCHCRLVVPPSIQPSALGIQKLRCAKCRNVSVFAVPAPSPDDLKRPAAFTKEAREGTGEGGARVTPPAVVPLKTASSAAAAAAAIAQTRGLSGEKIQPRMTINGQRILSELVGQAAKKGGGRAEGAGARNGDS